VRIFTIDDAVSCAKRGQKVPTGCHGIEHMLRPLPRSGGETGVCSTFIDARGITDEELADEYHRSVDELTDWTQWANRALVSRGCADPI